MAEVQSPSLQHSFQSSSCLQLPEEWCSHLPHPRAGGKPGGEATMAKLGWPKGGFDSLTAVKPWSSSTSRAPASQSLWKGCRTSLESLMGGTGLFLQLLRFHSHDQMNHRGDVPPWSPSPQLPFCTLCAGLDNLPLPLCPAHTGSHQHVFKSLCVLESSLPVSWEMDSSSPHIPKAAKLL